MVKCCVPGCKSIYKRKVDNKFDPSYITFHRFPKSPERIKQWERAINRPDWSANYNSRICSQHFAKNAYYTTPNEVVLLKVDAMPTELLVIPDATVQQQILSSPTIVKQDPDKYEDGLQNTCNSAPEIKKEPSVTSGTRSYNQDQISLEVEFERDVKQEPDSASDMDLDSNKAVDPLALALDPDFAPCPDDSPVTKKMKNHILSLEEENAKQKLKIKTLTQKVRKLQAQIIIATL